MDSKKSDVVRPGLWAQPKFIDGIKKKLRAKIPKLTLYDIRVERYPYHEAILCELYEAGFKQSAQLVENLIEMETEYKASHKLTDLYLKTNAGKHCLATIAEYTRKAELELRNGNKENSVEIFLQLAQQLSSQEDQLWIVEQIYISSIRATKLYRLDGGLLEARVRYYYGKFLIERGGLFDIAYETLNIAHTMSIARGWTILSDAGVEKQLCKEVSYLLFLCLSNKVVSQPHKIALESSKKALKFALASQNKFIIPRAYLERGDKEMDDKNYDEAVKLYTKAISHAQVSNQTDYICQGYLKKGYALQKTGQVNRATAFAKLAKRAAEESDSKYFLAKSYMLEGEIAVTRLFMKAAGSNYMTAADIFSELGDEKLAREARFLGAYAMSRFVLEQLVDLIRQSDQRLVPDGFERLTQWKERRIPFWDPDDENQSVKKIAIISDTERRKSIMAVFEQYESSPTAESKGLKRKRMVGWNVNLFREFRFLLSTF